MIHLLSGFVFGWVACLAWVFFHQGGVVAGKTHCKACHDMWASYRPEKFKE